MMRADWGGQDSARPARRCRGMLLIDVVMGAAVLAVALAVTIAVISRLAVARRGVDRRQFAINAVQNLMEVAASRPFEHLTRDGLSDLRVDDVTQRVLVAPRLTIDARDDAPGTHPVGRWIVIELTWPGAGGIDERPARLVTWRARPPGGSP